MPDINQEIAELVAFKAGMDSNDNDAHGYAHDELAKIKRRIIAGETTGDRIKDFVLCRYTTHSYFFCGEAYREKIKVLELKIRQHVGQFVLMTYLVDDLGDGNKRLRMYFGVIAAPQLVLDVRQGCKIPTQGYVQPTINGYSDWPGALGVPDNERERYFDLVQYLDSDEYHGISIRVLVGDVVVRSWLEGNAKAFSSTLACFIGVANKLGRPLEDYLARERQKVCDGLNALDEEEKKFAASATARREVFMQRACQLGMMGDQLAPVLGGDLES